MTSSDRTDIIKALKAVTEYAAESASDRDERPQCITTARAILAEEKRLQHLMESPPCYGEGCEYCRPTS